MIDDVFIMLPVEVGRRDDHLSATERAFADALAEFPMARLAAIFEAAASLAWLRLELERIGGV